MCVADHEHEAKEIENQLKLVYLKHFKPNTIENNDFKPCKVQSWRNQTTSLFLIWLLTEGQETITLATDVHSESAKNHKTTNWK